MSAFVVENEHIDAMLTAGLAWQQHGPLRWMIPDEPAEGDYERGSPWGPNSVKHCQQRSRTLTPETADCVGAMLLGENRRSVNFRYNEEDPDEDSYTFSRLPGHVDPIVVLKAIACYEYQSCEHPEWPKSEAYAFCEALRRAAINQLPGYDDAPGWSITDHKVFVKR